MFRLLLFQFQYGSIGSSRIRILQTEADYVSIPVWFDWELVAWVKRASAAPFQFQYGSIGRSMPTTCIPASLNGFNSSMVRLGGIAQRGYWETGAKFQFQYGSIGRNTTFCDIFCKNIVSIPVWFDWEIEGDIVKCQRWTFQFQYGSIGRPLLYCILQLIDSFNSSMVRLGGH